MLELTCEGRCLVPVPVQAHVPPICCSVEENRLCLSIELLEGTLKHFYPNYKDYYYLIYEDTAIHKSVGMYVDKQFRKPARASNCYTKKEGLFLPLPPGLDYENDILFRTDYKSRQHYILWDDKAKQNPSRMEDLLYNLT